MLGTPREDNEGPMAKEMKPHGPGFLVRIAGAFAEMPSELGRGRHRVKGPKTVLRFRVLKQIFLANSKPLQPSRGKALKNETPGSDIRNLPKGREIAAHEARNVRDVFVSRKASKIRHFLFETVASNTPIQAINTPTRHSQQQQRHTHKATRTHRTDAAAL